MSGASLTDKIKVSGYKARGLEKLLILPLTKPGLFSSCFVSCYPVSNECLSNLGKEIGSDRLSSVERYIGICGGGTQNLELIGELGRPLKSITLVDLSRWQLENFRKVVDIYNSNEREEDYVKELERHYKTVNPRNSHFPGISERPVVQRQPSVCLVRSSLEKAVAAINEPGVYMIYASNILDLIWGRWGKIRDVLCSSILKNENIAEGSIVVCTRPSDSGLSLVNAYEKCGKRLRNLESNSVVADMQNFHSLY